MYQIRYNARTYHITGVPGFTCAALERMGNLTEAGQQFDDLAAALGNIRAAARVNARKLCARCEKAAERAVEAAKTAARVNVAEAEARVHTTRTLAPRAPLTRADLNPITPDAHVSIVTNDGRRITGRFVGAGPEVMRIEGHDGTRTHLNLGYVQVMEYATYGADGDATWHPVGAPAEAEAPRTGGEAFAAARAQHLAEGPDRTCQEPWCPVTFPGSAPGDYCPDHTPEPQPEPEPAPSGARRYQVKLNQVVTTTVYVTAADPDAAVALAADELGDLCIQCAGGGPHESASVTEVDRVVSDHYDEPEVVELDEHGCYVATVQGERAAAEAFARALARGGPAKTDTWVSLSAVVGALNREARRQAPVVVDTPPAALAAPEADWLAMAAPFARARAAAPIAEASEGDDPVRAFDLAAREYQYMAGRFAQTGHDDDADRADAALAQFREAAAAAGRCAAISLDRACSELAGYGDTTCAAHYGADGDRRD